MLSPLFLGQLKNLHKEVLTTFRQELKEELRGESYHFGEVVMKARERLESRFKAGAEEARKVKEDDESEAEWSWREEEELLKDDVSAVASQMRADETKKMVNQIEVCGQILALGHCTLICSTSANFQEANFRASRAVPK